MRTTIVQSEWELHRAVRALDPEGVVVMEDVTKTMKTVGSEIGQHWVLGDGRLVADHQAEDEIRGTATVMMELMAMTVDLFAHVEGELVEGETIAILMKSTSDAPSVAL